MMGKERVRLLLVEDMPADAELIGRELRESGIDFDMRRVETREDYIRSLEEFEPDVVLSDYTLPLFSGMEALKIRNESAPLVPFLLVTGSINEETAVGCMRFGATDYLIKGHLERLGPSVRSALKEKMVREEKAEIERKLIASEKKYREFVEMLPQSVFEMDADGYFVYVNRAGFDIFQYGPEDLSEGLHMSRLIVPRDHDRLAANVRKRLKGFVSSGEEYTAQRKDGTTFPVIIFSQPVTDRGKRVGLRGILIDISELKKTEGELFEERRLLDLLLNHSTDGIYFKDREGRFTRVNRTLAQRMGLDDADSAVGKTDSDFFSEETAQESFADEQAIIASGHPIEVKEERKVWPNGREDWISTSKVPIVDADGTISGTFGISRDITRQKKSEQELKRHLEELSLLNEAAAGFIGKNSITELNEYLGNLIKKLSAAPYLLISSFDPFTRTISIRLALGFGTFLPEITKNIGIDLFKMSITIADLTADEFGFLTSRKLFLVREGLHSVSARRIPRTTARGIERTLGIGSVHTIGFAWEGKLFGAVTLLLRKNQELQNRELIETLVNQAAIAVQRLLAEEILRKSEEKYRTLFEESKDVVYFTGSGGKWLDVNPAGVELFGYPSKEQLLESSFLDRYVNQEDREQFLKMLLAKRDVKDHPMVLKKMDGQKVNVLITGTAEKIENGVVAGFRGIMHDVTEQKKMEMQLVQSQKMDAIGRLAGGIAHDFNNLLTTVIGNTDLLLEMCKDVPSAIDRLRTVRETATRAAQLTRQLLTMSRKQAVEPMVLNLNEVIRGLDKIFVRLLGEDIVFKYHLDSPLPLIRADIGQIEQVLLNLVINSRQAMPEGGKIFISTQDTPIDKPSVTLTPAISTGRYIQLSVTDTGEGIPAEAMSQIFEPFYTTKPGGTGLGLSIVYGIVKQSRGHILVYSEPKQGTTFRILFPAINVEHPVSGKTDERKPDGMSTGSETLLVVEDEPAILQLVQVVLSNLGYRVFAARNAEEATIRSQSYAGAIDLLLSDVILPGERGPELAKKLKRERPGLTVLFMSGYTDNRIDSETVAGMKADFLPKPFSPSDLARKIRQVLDERKG